MLNFQLIEYYNNIYFTKMYTTNKLTAINLSHNLTHTKFLFFLSCKPNFSVSAFK